METGVGEGSETGLVMKKKGEHKSTTSIGASLSPDYMIKRRATRLVEKSSNRGDLST